MKQKESRYPEDWLRIGQKELRRAEILLAAGDFEGAGFNIQQAIEKYLKGFLLAKGWKLRKIHDLETILNDAVVYEQSLGKYRADLQKITEYYVIDRYPLTITSELTDEEIKKSFELALQLINEITLMIDEFKG